MGSYDGPDGRPPMPEWAVAASLMLVGFGIYANTLHAGFTFDDNFAVVQNKDVTDLSTPLEEILQHDFWGQGIRGDQSHKSYRPLTILSFRAIRSLSLSSLAQGDEIIGTTTPVGAPPVPSAGDGRPGRAGAPDPFFFHFANAMLHAVVCYLVYWLSYELAVVRVGLKMHSSGQMLEMLISNQVARSAQLLQAREAAAVGGKATAKKGTAQAGTMSPAAAQAQAGLARKGSAGKRTSPEEMQMGMALDLENTLGAMWLVQCGRLSARCQREAVLAAVLFALHPVHCEAVAGIVGHAELLSAAFALLGLISYIVAIKSRERFVLPSCQRPGGSGNSTNATGSANGSRGAHSTPAKGVQSPETMSEPHPDQLGCFSHWVLIIFSLACCWAAALAKEIGITIAGAMLAFDILLAPIEPLPPPGVSGDSDRKRVATFRAKQWRRKMARYAILCLSTLAYIKMRNWVAGDHLVRIYRKVENPIPFAEAWETRLMTTGFLHAKYASLLVLPLYLSADWSFACISYVESATDPRNLMTAALYGLLLWVLLSAAPWEILIEFLGGSRRQDSSGHPPGMFSLKQGDKDSGAQTLRWYGVVLPRLHVARWRLFVATGLVVAPYVPASNVLFYVGTFIGERLLYFPSVGYCLLLAYLLDSLGTSMSPTTSSQFPPCEVSLTQKMSTASPSGKAMPVTMVDVQPRGTPLPASNGDTAAANAASEESAGDGSRPASRPHVTRIGSGNGHRENPDSLTSMVKSIACITLVSAILLAYGVRCSLRNRDWESDESLFLSAGAVCSRSAKVQVNLGILNRRKFNWVGALEHFRAARALEPTYCEPTYWHGLTLINQGQAMEAGVRELEVAIGCKYIATDAVQALNTIYKVMHESNPMDGRHLVSWANILMRPEVGRPFDACHILEQAAVLAVSGHMQNITRAKAAASTCTKATLPPVDSGLVLPALWQGEDAEEMYAKVAASFTRLKECVKARMKVMKVIHTSGNDMKAKSVKAAAYAYLVNHGDKCRAPIGPMPQPGSVGGGPSKGDPNLHMQLIHRLQSTHAEDAWLQREWGEILLQDSRPREAATHFEVAAMLLVSQLKQHVSGLPIALLALNGTGVVQPLVAARAALECFDRAHKLGPNDLCRLQYHACETHLLLVQLLAQGGEEVTAERKAAKDRIRALYLLPACRQYSRLLSHAFADTSAPKAARGT